jgi:hypothetical protein
MKNFLFFICQDNKHSYIPFLPKFGIFFTSSYIANHFSVHKIKAKHQLAALYFTVQMKRWEKTGTS